MSAPSSLLKIMAIAALVLTAACNPATRGVGPQPTPVTLTLAAASGESLELQPFIEAVSRLSDGSIQISYKGQVHAGEDGIEASLLNDVAAGTYDLTWTAQRPWPARGNKAFDALVAPFLVDSYDLERAVLEDPIVDEMIASVRESGLIGVGVVPGPLRFIAAREPVRRPADLTGAVVGIDDTWVASETVKALGGSTAFPKKENLKTLAGAVAQLPAIAANQWDTELPNVSAGIPLWPRPVIVVMNRSRYDGLTESQRRALRDGIKASVARRAEQLAAEDERALESLCAGASIPMASVDDRSAFRMASAPVYEQLNRDATTATFIRRVEALKSALGPRTPYACEEAARESDQPGLGIPNGTYRISLTADEVEAWIRENNVPADAEIPFKPTACPCAYSFTLRGTELIGDDGAPWRLSYFGGDHVSIGDNFGTYGFRWSFADGKLTLSDITGGAWGDAEVWTIKPWKRDP